MKRNGMERSETKRENKTTKTKNKNNKQSGKNELKQKHRKRTLKGTKGVKSD